MLPCFFKEQQQSYQGVTDRKMVDFSNSGIAETALASARYAYVLI